MQSLEVHAEVVGQLLEGVLSFHIGGCLALLAGLVWNHLFRAEEVLEAVLQSDFVGLDKAMIG